MLHRIVSNWWKLTLLGLAIVLTAHGGPAYAATLAGIENMTVTPRDVGTSKTLGYPLVASGINTVGIGKEVYLKAVPNAGAVISGYNWSVTAQPSAGATGIDPTSNSTTFKFHPTKGGRYTITLTPLQNSQPTTSTSISLWASQYLGAIGGGWNCASCHGTSEYAGDDKVTPWSGTKHATKLTRHLNGQIPGTYRTSCLPCHTVGAYANTSGDNNFLDVTRQIGFDLNQIPLWVADALSSGTQHWNDLPARLQQVANIQCESCHGPGKTHNGDTSRISVPSFDSKVCWVCHDAPTHHMRPYQWRKSRHSLSTGSGQGAEANCVKCHTSEGFVSIQVDGDPAIPADLTSRNPVACVGCHDPHDATNEHQLRKVDPVTLPNGLTFDFGLGNLCANCHNSRIASAARSVDLVTGSYRGPHHGPQADIFLGSSAYDWGRNFPMGASAHYYVVTDGCVDCHMAAAPGGSANPPPIGDHTFRINDDDSGTSTVAQACGECHPGLTTTDRVPIVPRDFDGNGTAQGIQSEVTGLLANLGAEILTRCAGTTLSTTKLKDEIRISMSTANWKLLNLNQRAALYNFNLVGADQSLGVHNSRFIIAVLQRSYMQLTGNPYKVAFPHAYLMDNQTTPIPTPTPTPTPTPNPNIQVLVPNGGEIWKTRGQAQIKWRTDPAVAGTAFRLELRRTGQTQPVQVWKHFIAFSRGMQDITTTVTVPSDSIVTPASDYRIRVVSYWLEQGRTPTPAEAYDDSDATFTIQAGSTIQVLAPNGGETGRAGQSVQIRWRTDPSVAGTAFRLELRREGQTQPVQVWKYFIASSRGPQDISATPIIPSGVTPASNYRIRVVSYWLEQGRTPTPAEAYDDSDATFTITQ